MSKRNKKKVVRKAKATLMKKVVSLYTGPRGRWSKDGHLWWQPALAMIVSISTVIARCWEVPGGRYEGYTWSGEFKLDVLSGNYLATVRCLVPRGVDPAAEEYFQNAVGWLVYDDEGNPVSFDGIWIDCNHGTKIAVEKLHKEVETFSFPIVKK